MDTLTAIVKKAANGDEAHAESMLTQRTKLTDFGCYEELVKAFSDRCFHLSKVRSTSLYGTREYGPLKLGFLFFISEWIRLPSAVRAGQPLPISGDQKPCSVGRERGLPVS